MEQVEKKEKLVNVSKADLLDELYMLRDTYPDEFLEWIKDNIHCTNNLRDTDVLEWT
jgi:hypothetical protein